MQLSKNEIKINNIHATYNDSCFIKSVYTMNSCHSNDCNYYKCVNAVAKVTHYQIGYHSNDCDYYECVNAGAKLRTRKSTVTHMTAIIMSV